MDPTILNPPVLYANPAHRGVSQSPSRSPLRRQKFATDELDPLLSELSPTSTLEALQSTDSVLSEVNHHRSKLKDWITAASTSERAWGIKAALAGKKARDWYRELAAWPWPAATQATAYRNGFEPGEIATSTLQQYEERIEEIRDDMETLELEELKNYVRNTHLPSTSRRSTYEHSGTENVSGYTHLDDFTAVITTTIMHILPDISRLNILLGIWSIRLVILRQVPGLLESMDKTRAAMDSAWKTIREPHFKDPLSNSALDRDAVATMRVVLETHIIELGRRLDSMLDTLEGREDTVPDRWIDELESIEADFGNWFVEADNLVLQKELRATGASGSNRNNVTVDPSKEGQGHRMNTVDSSDKLIMKEGDNLETPSSLDPIQHGNDEKMQLEPADLVGVGAQSVSDASEQPIAPEQYYPSEAEPVTPCHGRSKRSSGISNHSQNLLSSREASTDNSISRFAFSPASSPSITQAEKAMLSSDRKVSRSRGNSKPTPLNLSKAQPIIEGNVNADFSSDNSYPGSATSDYFSNMSSPEIQHASRAEYFGAPVEVTSPSFMHRDLGFPSETVSRQSSQRTERGRPASADFSSQGFSPPLGARSRASSFIPETTILEDKLEPQLTDGKDNRSHLRTRSASMQFFEVVPRNEIRSVTVRRSGSHSATLTPQSRHAKEPSTGLLTLGTANCRPSTYTKIASNSEALVINGTDRDSQVTVDSGHSVSPGLHPPISDVVGPLQEPSGIAQDNSPTSHNMQNKFEDVADSGITPVKIRQQKKSDPVSPFKPTSKHSSPSKQSSEQLEARISSILTEIPAHIRLTSGPEADAREVRHPGFDASDIKSSTARQTPPRFTRAQTSVHSPSITLAPAQPKHTPSRSAADPEIKLYHLHQAGKDAPIKLFVRLVGEGGERVMVRIGGGWADLGEYLKEYATHHGKRSVSDSRYAFEGMPSSPVVSSPQAVGAATAPNSRPSTSSGLDIVATPMTPDDMDFGAFQATPGSIPFNAALRPGSRHSTSEEESPLGGAGPKAKRVDISPSKQAWVDGMLDQARRAGTEKFSKANTDLGDLGKVGGTKRVFLRSKTTG